MLGCQELDGVRIESDCGGGGAQRLSRLHHPAQQPLMSQVDSIEVANGHHARARRLRELPEIVDDPHVLRTEKRKTGGSTAS